MKKRILSIVLAVVMVLTLVPAIALVSFADEGAETVKDYDYYKDLWYDDGHLVSFVDVYGTQASMAKNAADVSADALMLMGNGSQSLQGVDGNLRNFIKILGGTNAGKYYQFSTLKGHYINSGKFDTSKTEATNLYELVEKEGTNGAYAIHLGQVFTYEQATATGTGASSDVNSLDAMYRTQGNVFTVEQIIDYNDAAVVQYNNTMRFAGKTIGVTYRPNAVSIVGIAQNQNTTAYDTATPASDTVQLAATFTIKSYDDTTLSFHIKHSAYNNGVMYSSTDANSTYSNLDVTTDGANLIASSADKQTMLMAEANWHNNIVYLRVYDCALTAEQMAQNHFADLCYYYRLDISSLKQYEALGIIDGEFYSIFANYEVGRCAAETVALMQKYVNDPDYDPALDNDYVLDAYTQKYIDLYYDDGHLMALLNMANITESETVYLDGATVPAETTSQVIAADGAVPEDARLIIGQKNEAYRQKGGAAEQTHSYIKIVGGKYAGMYFMLGSLSTSPQIERTADGFVDPYAQVSQFATDNAGIHFAYAFDRSQINTKFSGLDNLGAVSPIVTSFVRPSSEMNYSGNYGAFSVEQVFLGNAYRTYRQQEFLNQNPSYAEYPGTFDHLLYYSGQSLGCMRYAGTDFMTDFSTGYIHSKGAQATKIKIESTSTVHSVYTTRFVQSNSFSNSMYFIDNGKTVKATGGALEYDYVDKIYENRIGLDGTKMYIARIYDTILTEEQVMQNHFADLCLYYGLENTEKLALYADLVLNNAFYTQFLEYEVGYCDSNAIQKMQQLIDGKISEIDSLSIDAANTALGNVYNALLAQRQKLADAASDLEELVAIVEGYIQQINSVDAVNSSASAIIAEKNEAISKVLDELKQIHGEIVIMEIRADKLVSDATAEYEAIGESSQKDEIMTAYSVIAENLIILTDYASTAALDATNAVPVKDSANADVKFALDANSLASISGTDFIKYLGMQIRINDYAAMRAVFSVNHAALENGYNYGGKQYNVVASGMLCGKAEDGFSAITVSYENGRLVAGAGVAVREFESRYGVNVETGGRGFQNGEEYAISTSFATVAASQMKAELTVEYSYRAFIVFEGEGITFVIYVDGVNQTLGNGISIYELAKAVAAMPNIEPAWLAETNYIAKVIAYVEED